MIFTRLFEQQQQACQTNTFQNACESFLLFQINRDFNQDSINIYKLTTILELPWTANFFTLKVCLDN